MSQPGQCVALQQQWQQQQPHIVKCDLHLRQSSQSVTQSLAIPLIYSLARRWLFGWLDGGWKSCLQWLNKVRVQCSRHLIRKCLVMSAACLLPTVALLRVMIDGIDTTIK